MFGWRGRIGLILPMDNVVMEPELYSLGISGVSFHGVRLTTKERRRMPDQAIALAPVFIETGVDLIVYACAETSFLGDAVDHQRVGEEITAATEIPCVTAVGAMVEALQTLGASKISLVTPYTAVRTQVMVECLSRFGLHTVRAIQRDFNEGTSELRDWFHTNRQPFHVPYSMAREADHPESEALLITATNFRTFRVIPALEHDLRKPVVTSNQAIIWAALRHLGIREELPILRSLQNS